MTEHEADIERYIASVLDGSIVTGRLERLAVWRHVEDLKHAGSRGFYFDPKPALVALNFANLCRQFESPFAGQPLRLRPDQKFLVWNMMGWRQVATGFRRFRQVQYELARKGGKSTTAAYLACLFLFCDYPVEEGSQIYTAATKEEQAQIVWNAALKMIQRSPALLKRSKITESKLRIELPELSSIFRPLAADKTPDGFNPHCIIKDEEHAWRERHRTQSDTLGSGFGTRNQPITITITTYGNDESNIWKENHDYAVRCLESVIDGEIVDDTWFAMIHALDRQETPCFRCRGDYCPWCGGTGTIPIDDPFDSRIWRKANPGIGPGPGFTPQLERMQESANVARNRVDKQSEFFQKNLNIIVASRDKPVSAEAWAACRVEKLSDWTQAARIHGGFDLGRSNDMAAAAMVARFDLVDDEGEEFNRFELQGCAWTCEERHEDVRTAEVARWIADGFLEESPGDQVSFMDVEDWIVAQSKVWGVSTWAYDPNFAAVTGQRLLNTHGLTVFEFTQSPVFYNNPVRLLISSLTKVHTVNGQPVRCLGHDGHPVLGWMMRNLIIRKNARDEWMPDKGSSKQKIDLAVSGIMGVSECMFSETGGRSVYETQNRGFVEIG